MFEAIQPQRKRQQNGKPQRYTLTYDRGRFIPCTISARLVLWTGKRYLAFRAEDIPIQARNPMPSARRHVEIAYFRLNMGRYTVPIKLRVSIDDVGGRFITKLPIHSDLFKLVEKGVCFSNVVGVAKLPNEVCCSNDRRFLMEFLIFSGRKSGAFDRISNALFIERSNARPRVLSP